MTPPPPTTTTMQSMMRLKSTTRTKSCIATHHHDDDEIITRQRLGINREWYSSNRRRRNTNVVLQPVMRMLMLLLLARFSFLAVSEAFALSSFTSKSRHNHQHFYHRVDVSRSPASRQQQQQSAFQTHRQGRHNNHAANSFSTTTRLLLASSSSSSFRAKENDEDLGLTTTTTEDSDNKNNNNNFMDDAQFFASGAYTQDAGLTLESFNMDLSNLAADDPRKAQDAVDIMYELHVKKLQQQQQQEQSTLDDNHHNASSPMLLFSTIEPDARCYTTVIDGYVQAGDPASAQAMLDVMEQRLLAMSSSTSRRRNGNDDKNATATATATASDAANRASMEYAYMLVAQAWADDDTRGDFLGQSADKAEQLLVRMLQRQPQQQQGDKGDGDDGAQGFYSTPSLVPSVKMWSVVLDGWCKRTGNCRNALERAEALLSEMEEAWTELGADEGGDHVAKEVTYATTRGAPPPNIVTYTSYIGGLARSKDRELARKAEATLVRMRQHQVEPDVVAYTSVLNCWSRAVSRREREMAASRALRLLDEMERAYIQKNQQLAKPSHITYSAAIKAIGNSFDPNAPQLAEDVLRRMYRLHNSKTISNMKPTTTTWNAVLNAISRATTGAEAKIRYAHRAEQILAEMQERGAGSEPDVRPDVRTWAAVLRAWSMSGAPNAAENTQRILDKMEALYESGETKIRPNYVCYTTVMGAWARSKQKDALDRLEQILMKMERAYEDTQEADLRPNTISYVTAIDAFVRRNEFNAAVRAQATVDRMVRLYNKGLGHVKPTKIVLNTLIHAWSKSKQKGAAQRAEKIFQWMEAQAKDGDDLVRPDEVSLCAVLNAWANQAENGGAKRAQQILEHMQSIPLERRGFHLSIMMPNIVIKAIARSGEKDAVCRAEAILEKLESDYIFDKSSLKADVTTYSSVINCCAYYKGSLEGRAEALEVALRTFQKLCDLEDDGPNNVTFGTIFKAIANLMPQGAAREALVSDLFDQCCEEGQIDAFVLSQVRNASPSLYRDMVEEPCGLGGPESDNSIKSVLQNIPQEWSQNRVVD